MTRRLAPALLVTLVLAACAEGSFTGDSGIDRGVSGGGKPPKDAPTTTPQGGNVTNGEDSADATKPGSSPRPGDTTDGRPPQPGTPQEGQDDRPPVGPGEQTDQGGGPGFLDMFGGLVDLLKNVKVDQPSQDEVIFGGDKVFHIGDDNFDASTCKFQIDAYPRTGVTYYFEFEVTEDDTHVDLAINKVCGVDYPDSNFVSIAQGATKIVEQPVAKGAARIELPGQTLAKGKYEIVVESRRGAAQNANDNDDYVVGLIHVKGDKPLKAGQVGTRD